MDRRHLEGRAPAGVPAPVQQKLIAIFDKAIESPRFKAFAKDNGFIVSGLTGSALTKAIDEVQVSLNEVGQKVFAGAKKAQ